MSMAEWPESESGSPAPEQGNAHYPFFSTILMGAPVSVKKVAQSESEGANGEHAQFFLRPPRTWAD